MLGPRTPTTHLISHSSSVSGCLLYPEHAWRNNKSRLSPRANDSRTFRPTEVKISPPTTVDVVQIGGVAVGIRFIFRQVCPLTRGVRVDVEDRVLIRGVLPAGGCFLAAAHLFGSRAAGVLTAERNLFRFRSHHALAIE